jgi:hypothetical protein
MVIMFDSERFHGSIPDGAIAFSCELNSIFCLLNIIMIFMSVETIDCFIIEHKLSY